MLEQVDHHPYEVALELLHLAQSRKILVDGDQFEQVSDGSFGNVED